MDDSTYLATYIGDTGQTIDNGHEIHILFYNKDYYIRDYRKFDDSEHTLSIYSLNEDKYLGKLKYNGLFVKVDTYWKIKKRIP